MKNATIKEVRKIVEEHGARQGILILFDDGNMSAASYGETKAECASLRKTLDDIADKLANGEIRWP